MKSICIIGAGYSGICAAIKIKQSLGRDVHLTIYDENHDFGGVWLKNTYPGCASDVPCHVYSLSFELNPEWSHNYCNQPEILAYLRNVALKHNLYAIAKFQHKIVNLEYFDASSSVNNKCHWSVTYLDPEGCKRQTIYDIVINAQGRFVSPQVPPLFQDFKGPIVHSADWNHHVNLANKTVAIIGTGASGAQIIPEIARDVKRLLVYQRSAPWIVPRSQFRFPWIIRKIFAWVPFVQRIYRYYISSTFERFFPGFRKNTAANKFVIWLCNSYLNSQIKDPVLRGKLKPNYPFGCKRIVPSSDYYHTFTLEHVDLITEPITKVSDHSITTQDNKSETVDVLVLATGFQVLNYGQGLEIKSPVPNKLKGKENLFTRWKEHRPEAYLGIMTHLVPNMFFLLGPNSATGYTSVLIQLESQVTWVIKVIQEMISRGAQEVAVKASVESKYMDHITKLLENTVYTSEECLKCNSWYLDSKGSVIEIYPDRTEAYKKLTMNCNSDDLFFS